MMQKNANAAFISSLFLPAISFASQCTNTGCDAFSKLIFFDGHDLAVVNWQNRLFICYEHVLEFMEMHRSGMGVQAWWESKISVLTGSLMESSTKVRETRQRLHNYRGQICEAIVGAAELMCLKEQNFFCCESPTAISMDGIVLSIKKANMPKFEQPWVLPGVATTRSSYKFERQLLALTSSDLTLLDAFMDQQRGVTNAVLRQCSRHPNHGFQLLFSMYIPSSSQHGLFVGSPKLRYLSNFLCKDVAPVVSLVPYVIKDVIISMGELGTRTPSESLRKCNLHSPILYSIFRVIERDFNNPTVWSIFKSFIQQAKSALDATYASTEDGIVEECSPISFDNHPLSRVVPNKDLTEMWATGFYFPGRPAIRKFQNVELSAPTNSCNKTSNQGGTCAQGVILFHCLDHNACLGFVILDVPESPKKIYEVLLTRFKLLPSVIIYDNACNLQEYILNRAPWQFRRTQFFVDHFHFFSHTNCASTFNSGEYTQLLEKTNSQLTEQKNSRVTVMKQTAVQKKFRTFAAFLRYFVGLLNDRQHALNTRRL